MEVVSCGVPFLFVPARRIHDIRNIRFRRDVWERALQDFGTTHVFAFTQETEFSCFTVHSRMFAPALGISEYPATGAASDPRGCYLRKTHMNILVTGGTGHLGRDFVQAAMAAGHGVRIASRRPRPADISDELEWATMDLSTGEGIRESLAGVDAIIHAASDPKNTTAADVVGTRRLAEAARDAGVGHLVYVSIVGIDRIPFSYYQRKLAAERALAESGAPYSILRATQFHYFVDLLLGAAARVPLVLPLPAGFHVQSVATEDVADRLLRAITDGPSGLLRDFAGPEPMTLAEAAAAWKAARGVRKPTIPIPIPGRIGAAFRAGYNIAPNGERGVIGWREWLEQNVFSSA